MAVQFLESTRLHRPTVEKLANELKPILFPMIEDMVRETWLTGDYGERNHVTGATVLLSACNSHKIFNVTSKYESCFHNAEEYLASAMPIIAAEVAETTQLELSYQIIRYDDYNKIELNLKEILE